MVSETLIIRLLQVSEEHHHHAIKRFRAFLTWLSANSMEADKKDEVLEMFDFNLFTAEELASVVRTSGLYSSDKIIARMLELCRDHETEHYELENMLEEKDDDIYQLESRLEGKNDELKDKDDEISQLEARLEGKEFEIVYLKGELKDNEYEIDHLEEELRKEETIFEFELSAKDQKINHLKKEKQSLEKTLNNRKRKMEDPNFKGVKGKAAKY